jgi:hypothetical protein
MDDIDVSGNALIAEFETDKCKTGVTGLPRDGRQPSFSRVAMSNSQKGVVIMNIRSTTTRAVTKPGVRTRIIAVATGLLLASSAYAVNISEVVRMITHTDLVMQDGTTMHADIVKMHGKMYVMIPVDSLPDYLHQQVTKVMMH